MNYMYKACQRALLFHQKVKLEKFKPTNAKSKIDQYMTSGHFFRKKKVALRGIYRVKIGENRR
jgi:hypothetical protein